MFTGAIRFIRRIKGVSVTRVIRVMKIVVYNDPNNSSTNYVRYTKRDEGERKVTIGIIRIIYQGY